MVQSVAPATHCKVQDPSFFARVFPTVACINKIQSLNNSNIMLILSTHQEFTSRRTNNTHQMATVNTQAFLKSIPVTWSSLAPTPTQMARPTNSHLNICATVQVNNLMSAAATTTARHPICKIRTSSLMSWADKHPILKTTVSRSMEQLRQRPKTITTRTGRSKDSHFQVTNSTVNNKWEWAQGRS